MECQSAGLVSTQEYEGAVTVSVDVRAQAVGTSPSYWAGLALNADLKADNTYVQAAITQGIEPFTGLTKPHGVALSTTYNTCCTVLQEAPSDGWHHLSVIYTGRKATMCVDGQCTTVNWRAQSYQIELLCVADNPGTPNTGALTHCEFKNLVIK